MACESKKNQKDLATRFSYSIGASLSNVWVNEYHKSYSLIMVEHGDRAKQFEIHLEYTIKTGKKT